MKHKYIGILCVLLVCLLSCNQAKKQPVQQPTEASLAAVKERGSIRFGFDDSELPWVIYDPDTKTYSGFEYELATMLAAQLGVTAQFTSADWSILPNELLKGGFDVLINAYSEDDVENSDLYEWSDPYQDYGYVIVVRANDNTIKDFSDLVGKKVLSYIDAADLINSKGLAVKHEIIDDPGIGYIKVETGEADAFIYDMVSVNYILHSNTHLKIAGTPLSTGQYRLAVQKGKTELLKALNAALAVILPSQAYKDKSREWI